MQMPYAVERGHAHEEQMHQMAVVGHDTIHNFEPKPILVRWRWANREAIAIDKSQRKLRRLEQLGNRRVILRVGVPPCKREIEDRRRDESHDRHCPPSAPLELWRDRRTRSEARF